MHSWRDLPQGQAMQQHGGSRSSNPPPKQEPQERGQAKDDGKNKPIPSKGWGGR